MLTICLRFYGLLKGLLQIIHKTWPGTGPIAEAGIQAIERTPGTGAIGNENKCYLNVSILLFSAKNHHRPGSCLAKRMMTIDSKQNHNPLKILFPGRVPA
jgi:hypothetical protein